MKRAEMVVYFSCEKMQKTKRNSNIQHGNISATDCNPEEVTIISVTFPKAFNKVPDVLVSINSSSTMADYGKMTISTNGITTTGFTIRVYNSHTVKFVPGFKWFAIAI